MPTYYELLHAAEQGDGEAMYMLAEMFHHGYGVGKNPDEAARWYREALENGYTPPAGAWRIEEGAAAPSSRRREDDQTGDNGSRTILTSMALVGAMFFALWAFVVVTARVGLFFSLALFTIAGLALWGMFRKKGARG